MLLIFVERGRRCAFRRCICEATFACAVGSRLAESLPKFCFGEHRKEGMIAALYVEEGGAYYGLPDVDPWPESRDARLYAGPWPVVAHPPCKRWCRFAPGVETRFGYKVGDDGGCFRAALDAVRTYGGVLEHPAYSLAWRAFGLPHPIRGAGWLLSLDDPGMTCYVEQEYYGHPVKKGTWLYAVDVEPVSMHTAWRSDQDGGAVRWSRVRYAGDETRPRVAAAELSRTPPVFRDLLITTWPVPPPLLVVPQPGRTRDES